MDFHDGSSLLFAYRVDARRCFLEPLDFAVALAVVPRSPLSSPLLSSPVVALLCLPPVAGVIYDEGRD